ncbi:thiamine pyrophosphate-dependent enzyme, partial [Thiolapillus sp.]
LDAYFASPLALCARRVSSAASRLLGSTSLRFALHGWQRWQLCPPVVSIGGDGAMFDIGFQNLSRALASGMPVKILILDTQVYSNTGGQACTSGFVGQVADMSPYGKAMKGKVEIRKEISLIGMAHRTSFILQGSPSNTTHLIEGYQACLRPRDRFWDIPVPKIDSAFDNLLVPQPSWSPSTTQQLRKLVAAPYLAPNDWTPRSEAYFVFPLAQGTPGKQCGLAATGVYQPSLRSPWLAAIDGLNSRRPALFNIYSTCQPEHGVADDATARQSKLAVESR